LFLNSALNSDKVNTVIILFFDLLRQEGDHCPGSRMREVFMSQVHYGHNLHKQLYVMTHTCELNSRIIVAMMVFIISSINAH
jgi:hypothetical protein